MGIGASATVRLRTSDHRVAPSVPEGAEDSACSQSGRTPMIKDVMVWLDGGLSDEARLAAVADIAQPFESHVIELFLNPLPLPGPVDGDAAGALATAERMEQARQ